MVLPTGFEPVTLGFRDRSSTAELKAAHGNSRETRLQILVRRVCKFSYDAPATLASFTNENSEASRPD